MKGLLATITLAALLFLPGCGNLSPRQEQNIDNENGRIGEIESLANSIKLELGNLKTQNEIQDSQIGQMQQGLANYQSNNENSGVQILSGPGGITVAIVAIMSLTILTIHYRSLSKKYEKTSDILAENIVSRGDPELEERVFQAAMFTDVEEQVFEAITKYQN